MINRESWQIPHIESVLGYHNKSYSTDFVLAGRCEQFFPGLEGGWDWVCRDTNTAIKGAIEVKRLTDERKHEEESILSQVSIELENQMRGLRGTYRLLLYTDARPLNLSDNSKEKSKIIKELKRILQTTIEEMTPNMKASELLDLTCELRASLPGIVPADFDVELQKVTNEGSRLLIEVFTGGDAPSSVLQGEQFDKFKGLVKQANQQLHKAKTKGLSERFFISLDLLYHLAAPPNVIRNTFWQLNSDDHCDIVYAYHVASSVTRVKP
jgi:hypothetical protein